MHRKKYALLFHFSVPLLCYATPSNCCHSHFTRMLTQFFFQFQWVTFICYCCSFVFFSWIGHIQGNLLSITEKLYKKSIEWKILFVLKFHLLRSMLSLEKKEEENNNFRWVINVLWKCRLLLFTVYIEKPSNSCCLHFHWMLKNENLPKLIRMKWGNIT